MHRRRPCATFKESSFMKIKRIKVKSAAGPYEVLCGSGLLQRLAREIQALGKFSSVQVISSPKAWRAAGKSMRRGLGPRDAANLHLFDDAESLKNLRSVESLCRALTRAHADRKSLIVAVGGGVVGDVAGYVAASYLRGVSLVHVP